MNRIIRRSMIGILAGGAASAALIATAGHDAISLLLGATIGAAFAASAGQTDARPLSRPRRTGTLWA